jgi:hypothetical protein
MRTAGVEARRIYAAGSRRSCNAARFANGKDALFNMPMVAFNVSEDDLNTMCDGKVDYSKVEDKVLKICPRDGVVTLKLTLGYTFGKADLLPVHGGQRPRRRHA